MPDLRRTWRVRLRSLPQLLALALAVTAGCEGSGPPRGAGDVEPDGWTDDKSDQTCACGDGGELDDDRLLLGVNRDAGLARRFQPDTIAVPAAYRSHAGQLRPLALGYFMEMADAARADTGRVLKVGSGFRTFCTQCALFASYAASFGEKEANTFSAHAGHSEHQLGTTMDIFDESGSFLGGIYDIPGVADADPAIYAWLDEHAWRFGFMNSYPPNAADDGDRFRSRTFAYTKYIPEPWHWRFVGRHAAALHHRLQAETGERLSTHELIDVLAEPTAELAGPLAEALAALELTLDQLEDSHPDDEAALARAQDDLGCASGTLGRDVGHGDCVQVTRAACGEPRCGWFRCDQGEWLCTDLDACADEAFAHATCPGS